MYIKILANSRKEKGDLFEEFMEKVLDITGYENFRRGIQKTGRQIDLYAKNKVTGQPIICECKAHERPIGTGDVNKFYGIYDREYRQNNALIGLFFSLSGFVSTALAYYDTMPLEVKRRFFIRDDKFIISILRKTKIIASEDKLEYIIKSRIKHNLGKRYLVYTRTGVYWVQIVETKNKATHYIVLGPKGEEVSTYICTEIGLMDKELGYLELLDIYAMRKTIMALFDGSSKTPEEISKDTKESIETVLLALQDLLSQNIVLKGSPTYHLSKDPGTYLQLARQFLGSENEREFFISQYSDEMMNLSLINYCEHRFGLELDTQEKETVLRLIRVSPSALEEILFGSIEKHRTTDKHIKELKLSETEYMKVRKSQTEEFIGTLIRKLIVDLDKLSSKKILEKREIKGWRTQIAVDLARLESKYLSVKAESVIMVLPAKGKIQRGQLVSVTNYDLLGNIGLVLFNLGKTEKAIEFYDKIIAHVTNHDQLKAALTNKGLALAALKKYEEALECYNKAIEIDSRLKEAWYNKGLVYAIQGNYKEAIACYSKALEIDPDYSNALIEKQKSTRLLKSR
jgi:tetratricopeptide (TPR) repeat protein